MSRLLIANLDCELSWARHRLASHARLSDAVHRSLGALGLSMAVFAEPGDQLHLGSPSTKSRLGPLLADLDIDITDGALPRTASQVLAWGHTAEVHALAGGPDPNVVAELNDRRWSLAMEEHLDIGVSGARVIASQRDLEAAMAAWPHPRPWILKAPLSASGRDRIKRHGAPEADAVARSRRLLDRFGVLVLEPWLDRVADFGAVGWVRCDAIELEGGHGLEVDGNGVFRAIAIGVAVPSAVLTTAQTVGAHLADAGYSGPFGIDAFAYRDEYGEERLRPLCEINARMTFGHVARAALRRFGEPLGLGSAARLSVSRDPGADVTSSPGLLVRATETDPIAVGLGPPG